MAELALAIVPLCVAAIKGGKLVLKKCKELQQHDKEIERLRTQFRYQRGELHVWRDSVAFLDS